MATKTRDDIHRPADIIPANYWFVEEFYQGSSEEMWDCYKAEHQFLDNELGSPWHESDKLFDGNYKTKGTCDHCGAHFAYGVVYKHEPTGEYICVGHICASNTMMPGADEAERKVLLKKKEAKRLKKVAENRAAREAFLKEHPGLEEELQFDHYIVRDIASRFQDYCKISDKQIELVRKIIREAPEKEAAAKARDELKAKAEDVPLTDERVVIKGEVISVKEKMNDYTGYTDWKVTVQDERGFLVWGTLPSALESQWGDRDDGYYGEIQAMAQKGDVITFAARLTRSDKDPKFGFFKRPTKASFVSRVSA